MAVTVYTRGMRELSGFTSNTFKALLIKGSGYTPDPDHDYVADLVPASNEVSGAGYSRATLGTKSENIDDANDRIVYSCANPNFGNIAAGETVTGMVVFREVTNDSDSILIACYTFTGVGAGAVNPFIVTVPADGLLYQTQGS